MFVIQNIARRNVRSIRRTVCSQRTACLSRNATLADVRHPAETSRRGRAHFPKPQQRHFAPACKYVALFVPAGRHRLDEWPPSLAGTARPSRRENAKQWLCTATFFLPPSCPMMAGLALVAAAFVTSWPLCFYLVALSHWGRWAREWEEFERSVAFVKNDDGRFLRRTFEKNRRRRHIRKQEEEGGGYAPFEPAERLRN